MSIFLGGEEFLYQDEVAKKLGFATLSLKVKVRAKEIPLPIKLKSKNLWKKSEIDEYVKSINGS